MATIESEARELPATLRAAPSSARSVWMQQVWISGFSVVIGVMAVAATVAGIFTANGAHHRTFISLRGETIMLQGGGLYANDSVSAAAQAIGQDVVTLFVAVPLLLVAAWLAGRGSLRGRLLQAGLLWYFGYTYLLMAFGAAYNPFFLLYVGLYSVSIGAFVLALRSIDARWLRAQFSPRFARRTVAWLVIGFGALLTLLWLGRIGPALAAGTPPAGLESYSTLFVQAGDLGLVVPLAVTAGVLLLRRGSIGYLLAGVLLVKGATLGLALLSMMVVMARAGVELVPVEAVFFAAVTLLCAAGVLHLLRSLPARDAPRG
jgi:hypothetical protein